MLSNKTKHRYRLITAHWVAGIVIYSLAGILLAFITPWLSRVMSPLIHFLATGGSWGIGLVIVLTFISAAAIRPRAFQTTVDELRFFLCHLGFIIKSLLTLAVCLFVSLAILPNRVPALLCDDIPWLGGYCLLGLIAGLLTAWLIPETRKLRQASVVTSPDDSSGHTTSESLFQWLTDDQPVSDESQSFLPEHSRAARRILDRLLSQMGDDPDILPSVALLGPYGSGKTSICNLVEKQYLGWCKNKTLPTLVFCRFEAWQYLSAKSAAKGLLEVTTAEVLKKVNAPELWHMPEDYANAISEVAPTWAKLLLLLFKFPRTPRESLSELSRILERLGIRAVILVDDLDRIEGNSTEAQPAITQALNQIQDLPNLQYVLTLSPMASPSKHADGKPPSTDLLKLTRYQELVPSLHHSIVSEILVKLRTEVLKNPEDKYFPWAEMEKNEKDPLLFDEMDSSLPSYFRHSLAQGQRLSDKLITLLDTPRKLKSAMRDAHVFWNNGLSGEINWYNLLLISALKAAEPGVYAWIVRNQADFTEPFDHNSPSNKSDKEEFLADLDTHLKDGHQSDPDLITSTLRLLFPAIDGLVSNIVRDPSEVCQDLAFKPSSGRSYLERFVSGRLDEDELHDQPTLQMIRKIKRGNWTDHEFECMYLDSYEKLTGPLTKFIQFAGLLSLDEALEVAGIMMRWAAVPANASLWPDSPEFIHALMVNVYRIIDKSDSSAVHDRKRIHNASARIADWFVEQIDELWLKTVSVFDILFNMMEVNTGTIISPEEVEKLYTILAEKLHVGLLHSNCSLEHMLHPPPFTMTHLLNVLLNHPQYQSTKARITSSIIKQAEADNKGNLKGQLIWTLVGYRLPPSDGECPPEPCDFTVPEDANEKKLDMPQVLDALRRWANEKLPDKRTARAFEEVKKFYNITSQEPTSDIDSPPGQ